MRRLTLVLGLLLAAGLSATSSQSLSSGPINVIDEASIRGHMEFLAGDALNGRGSGTRDEWLAAAYIASNLRRWNIEPLGDAGDYVQTVRVNTNEVVAPPILTAGETVFTHGKEMITTAIGSYH